MNTRIITLIVILFTAQLYAQTYTVEVTYSTVHCHAPMFDWEVQTNLETVLVHNDVPPIQDVADELVTANTMAPAPVDFTLILNAQCIALGGSPLDCTVNDNTTKTASQLITGQTLFLSSCNGSISVSAIPDVSILNPPDNAEICMGALFALNATPGFPAAAYRWQYSADYGNWTDFPGAYQNLSSVNATMQDLLGANHADYFNTDIRVRLYNGGRTFDERTYTYSPCGPTLTSLTPDNANCSYGNGSFTAQFDSALGNGQTLDINIFEDNMGGPGPLFDSVVNVALDGSNSYDYAPDAIPPGDYHFSYGVTGANFSGPISFSISAPVPVTFNAIWTDVGCFGQDTGSIEITAGGGVEGYQYRLDNGSWINFDNQFMHIINGLSAGNYQLRVIDANGCTEQIP